MPAELNDIYLSRSALHIGQDTEISVFMENLLYHFVREESDENLNLLFAFLENYADLLEKEWKYCNM